MRLNGILQDHITVIWIVQFVTYIESKTPRSRSINEMVSIWIRSESDNTNSRIRIPIESDSDLIPCRVRLEIGRQSLIVRKGCRWCHLSRGSMQNPNAGHEDSPITTIVINPKSYVISSSKNFICPFLFRDWFNYQSAMWSTPTSWALTWFLALWGRRKDGSTVVKVILRKSKSMTNHKINSRFYTDMPAQDGTNPLLYLTTFFLIV